MCNATDLGRVQNITVKYAEYPCVTDSPFLVKSYNFLSFIRRILKLKPLGLHMRLLHDNNCIVQ